MRIVLIVFALLYDQSVFSQTHRYTVSSLEITGASKWTSQEIATSFQTSVGEPLSESRLEEDITTLINRYSDNGYPFAKAIIEKLQPIDSNHIAIRIRIVEGKLATLSDCRVHGLTETDTTVIKREFFLSHKPLATKENISNGVSHLRSTGLFSSVLDPRLYPITDSTVGIELFVQETRSTSIDGVLGYNPSPIPSQKAYINGFLDLAFINIGGSARQAQFRYQRMTPQSSDLDFRYKEPWLLAAPIDGTLSLARHDEDSLYIATHLEAAFTLHSIFAISVGVNSSYDIVSPGVSSFINRSNILSGGLSFTLDERDDRIAPQRGYRVALGASYGSKSITDSLGYTNTEPIRSLSAEAEGELNLGISQLIGALVVSAKQVRSPALERPDLFRIGGINSIRGYRDASFLVSQFATAKFEVRYMLAARSFIGIFTDAGYLNQIAYGAIPSQTWYPVGYGISMLFDTQIGYVQAAVAVGKGESFDRALLHFGLKTSL